MQGMYAWQVNDQCCSIACHALMWTELTKHRAFEAFLDFLQRVMKGRHRLLSSAMSFMRARPVIFLQAPLMSRRPQAFIGCHNQTDWPLTVRLFAACRSSSRCRAMTWRSCARSWPSSTPSRASAARCTRCFQGRRIKAASDSCAEDAPALGDLALVAGWMSCIQSQWLMESCIHSSRCPRTSAGPLRCARPDR